MPVCSGDSNTHSQNLAPAESPSQGDLMTSVSRHQEAPTITSVQSQRLTEPTAEVPDSHEEKPELLNDDPEISHAALTPSYSKVRSCVKNNS